MTASGWTAFGGWGPVVGGWWWARPPGEKAGGVRGGPRRRRRGARRWFVAAWVLAGLAQSALLYPPAFAALTGWYGPGRVRALTILTLVAGLSSTVFAPLVAALLEHLSWRTVYLLLAVVLAVVVLPLHGLCLTPPWPHTPPPGRRPRLPRTRQVLTSRAFVVLTVAMALAGFGMYAATLNLVPLL